ncbi:MAG: fibronectin type III domain-containing protein [Lachnospiraceae bacterium]|nr:fibronectin type III domain-containing protein [Lachnospiraceae bacterium]
MKQTKKLLFMLVFAVCFLAAGYKTKAFAAVKQTAQTDSTATVEWDANANATDYTVQIGADYKSIEGVAPVSTAGANSYTFTGLQAGMSYYVKVCYTFTKYDGSVVTDGYVGSVTIRTTAGKVTGVNQERWWKYIKSVDFKWTEQPGVDGYEWIAYNSKGKKYKKGENKYHSSVKATFSIDNNMIYTVKVRAYSNIDGKKVYGAWSAKAYLFTQPTVKSMKAKNGTMSVSWGKISGSTGYVVYASTNNKKFKKVGSTSAKKNSISFKKIGKKKLNTKKKVYIYIVAKKKVGKKTYDSGKNYSYMYESGRFNETYAQDR